MPNKPPKIMNNWAKIRYRFSPQHLIPQLATWWYMRVLNQHISWQFCSSTISRTKQPKMDSQLLIFLRFVSMPFVPQPIFPTFHFRPKPTWPPFSAFLYSGRPLPTIIPQGHSVKLQAFQGSPSARIFVSTPGSLGLGLVRTTYVLCISGPHWKRTPNLFVFSPFLSLFLSNKQLLQIKLETYLYYLILISWWSLFTLQKDRTSPSQFSSNTVL